mgnify:CR=1 FL=1
MGVPFFTPIFFTPFFYTHFFHTIFLLFLHQFFTPKNIPLKDSNDRTKKVLDFTHPRELKDKSDFTISLRDDKPVSLDQIVSDIRNTLTFGVKTGLKEIFL